MLASVQGEGFTMLHMSKTVSPVAGSSRPAGISTR